MKWYVGVLIAFIYSGIQSSRDSLIFHFSRGPRPCSSHTSHHITRSRARGFTFYLLSIRSNFKAKDLERMNSGMAIFKSETYPEFEIIDVVASKSSEWVELLRFSGSAKSRSNKSIAKEFWKLLRLYQPALWSGRCRLIARCREIPAESNHFAQSVLSLLKYKSILAEMPSRGWLESSFENFFSARLRSGVESTFCSRHENFYFDETRNEENTKKKV